MEEKKENFAKYLDLMKDKKKGTIQAKDNYYQLNFYCDVMQLSVKNNFSKFIKNVELLVRRSEEYKRYIWYLSNVVGLNQCMILNNVNTDTHEDVTIEMHHGPILTLYDIISIMIEHYINNEKKFNSLSLARKVIEEHYLHEVQVVMLSKTVHELVHDNKIFIHPRQAWGNINAFFAKFKDGIIPEMKERINNYLEISSKYRANDFGILEVGNYKDYSITFKEFKENGMKALVTTTEGEEKNDDNGVK